MEWRLEAFESRPSLWKVIEEYVPESERIEIKETLGEDLVDETSDLHNEVGYIYMYMYVCMLTFMSDNIMHYQSATDFSQ